MAEKGVRQMNKKKKFVADGVFHAELHSFFLRALTVAGYAGFEVRVTPLKTEVVIKATKTSEVVGPEGRRIKELASLIQKRFNYTKDNFDLKTVMVQHRGLCASAQAEALKFKLLSQVPVRTAANAILKQIMADGAVGAEIIISGKLSQQRAKSMKYRAGITLFISLRLHHLNWSTQERFHRFLLQTRLLQARNYGSQGQGLPSL